MRNHLHVKYVQLHLAKHDLCKLIIEFPMGRNLSSVRYVQLYFRVRIFEISILELTPVRPIQEWSMFCFICQSRIIILFLKKNSLEFTLGKNYISVKYVPLRIFQLHTQDRFKTVLESTEVRNLSNVKNVQLQSQTM